MLHRTHALSGVHLMDMILGISLCALAFLFGVFELWNVDIWWHLRTGQLMLTRIQEGMFPWEAVPVKDWYTYTNQNKDWIDLHWGFQILMAVIHQWGGIRALVLMKALVGAITMALGLCIRRMTGSVPLAVVVWLPALIIVSSRMYVRPEIFTVLFLMSFLLVLFHAPRLPGLLWLLPFIQILWVNFQGLFVFGPILVGAYFLDQMIFVWRHRHLSETVIPEIVSNDLARGQGAFSEHRPCEQVGSLKMLLVCLLVLFACFVNPYTWQGVLFPLQLFERVGTDHVFFKQRVGELRSVGDFLRDAPSMVQALANPYFAAIVITTLMAVMSFVLRGFWFLRAIEGRSYLVFRIVIVLGFSYLGWQTRRNVSHFAVVVGFVTLCNFSETWRYLRREHGNSQEQLKRYLTRLSMIGLMAGCVWLVVQNHFYEWTGSGRQFGVKERSNWFPHEAAVFSGKPGMPNKALITNWGHASVYIYHNGPESKVFMDGRLEVNDRATMESYEAITDSMTAGDGRWEHLLSEQMEPNNDLPAVVVEIAESQRRIDANWFRKNQTSDSLRQIARLGPLIFHLMRNPRWRCVYADSVAVVFIEHDRSRLRSLPELSARSFLGRVSGSR